ncbi:hypothetical protein [Spiroplasma endosymbiont of Zeiraphera isertana]|uniref:hypothetical protein n=1 Tax=Spiroplasma endosymbiont of Zeiraphera isertana TaxID=3066313 RepID=UPI00313A7CB2
MNLSNVNSLLQVLEQQKSLMKTKQSEIKDQTEVEKLKNEIETLITIIEQKNFFTKKKNKKILIKLIIYGFSPFMYYF